MSTLKELDFVGIKFREIYEFPSISRKLLPVEIIR